MGGRADPADPFDEVDGLGKSPALRQVFMAAVHPTDIELDIDDGLSVHLESEGFGFFEKGVERADGEIGLGHDILLNRSGLSKR
jgi:hypothetical protein